MSIANGKVGSFHYTLKNGNGDVLDSSEGRAPLSYLHGCGNIVPGLEAALEGKDVGDTFDAVIQPADGYGVRKGGPQPIDLDAFPKGVKLEPGMMVRGQTADGDDIALWIERIDSDKVWVDENHPLAGVTLHFAVEIVEIREASEEELEHGHPHGPGGHAH